ncbi:MAG: isochorismate synthase [Rhodocyclales bacterium GT-UBC]|nr:MAG: isochorismate synthase [Rhodocyclales bacterium GT-UBC]
MIERLRQRLLAPDLLRRLAHLADAAPASAPLSLSLDLGPGEENWLHLLPDQHACWYRARPKDKEYRLGIGHLLQVESCGGQRFAALDHAWSSLCRYWRHELAARPLTFAGFAFDEQGGSPLPNALLALPAILFESIDGHCRVTLNTLAGERERAIGNWLQWLAVPPTAGPRHNCGFSRPDPARDGPLADQAWMARVKAALRDIDAGRVDKLVLSRRRLLASSAHCTVREVLTGLLQQQAGSLIYAFGNGQQFFLGATPERLLWKNGCTVRADALAGTAWPGSPGLRAGKNHHEQSLVVRAVVEALAPLCATAPEVEAQSEQAAGRLRHLRNEICARLNPGTSVWDLVAALHPTPAIGGYPRPAALDWLRRHDEYRGAWYSGGFGLLEGNGDGEFSVALRSALFDAPYIELQAGAGIVAGSQATDELAETEAKLGTLLAALQPLTAARQQRQAG